MAKKDKMWDIEIPDGSTALESYGRGDIDEETAKRLILQAHIRHEHTDYDRIVAEKTEKVWNAGGHDPDSLAEAKAEARREARGNTT